MNNNIWNAWTSPMACKKSWVHHQHPPFKMQKSLTLASFFMCEFHQLLLFYAIVGAAVESMTDETLKLLSFKVSYVVCMKAKEWIKMTSNACCLFFLYIYVVWQSLLHELNIIIGAWEGKEDEENVSQHEVKVYLFLSESYVKRSLERLQKKL